MPDITLDNFVTAQTKHLLNFATAWRNSADAKPGKFPMSATDEAYWLRQFFGYTASTLEAAKHENDKKAA